MFRSAAPAASIRVPLIAVFVLLATFLATTGMVWSQGVRAAGSLQSPEQFIGFKVGEDNKLARWDAVAAYMKLAAAASDRVRVRELGTSTLGNPFLLVEIASPDTLKNLDRYKQLERKLYFQGGPPTPRERDEIFKTGKAVVLITSSVHADEVGGTQMSLELVHHLATDESAATRKILDNVIFLLVPSANPDGQIMVADWFAKNVGTPFLDSRMPTLYHPYAGHDLNRDMYMFTQKESQLMADLVWHDWLPTVWLDQHQMGSNGPRIFVMPAADPINPNVHPLIYRWNGILGQSQAAALEVAGKEGIIYNSTYTNFWQGALAWSGWWHNQIGLLTEVASARTAAPVEQLRAASSAPGSVPRMPQPAGGRGPGGGRGVAGCCAVAPLLPPTDVTPRTEYPRPWMGGRWTLRDIVDYQMISALALLETAADRRETLLRQIYEVNRQTVEERRPGEPAAIIIPVDGQQDAREAAYLVERLQRGGVEVHRAQAPFQAGGEPYAAGSFVVPMSQVFARYAKDLLERQVYPEVRRAPSMPAESPYDVTAWSLGLQFGVNVRFVNTPVSADARLVRLTEAPRLEGSVSGSGDRYVFEYTGAQTATAINRLLKDGANITFDQPSRVSVTDVSRQRMVALAEEFGLSVGSAGVPIVAPGDVPRPVPLRAPRVGLYASWNGGNIDAGWTRWVLEQHEFNVTTIFNPDLRRGWLRQQFDVVILPDQSPREIMDGATGDGVRPEYRGGIGEDGIENLARFVADGGTLIALGAASDLVIDRLPAPVRNLKRSLRREQHFGPGTIVRLQVDTSQPFGYGMAPETFGFYTNTPILAPIDGFTAFKTSVIARFPATNVVGSGWLQGEEHMAGRAAVVSIDVSPGRIVLFGIRPQHRGQTRATFPLLFNALYLASGDGGAVRTQD